MPPSVATIVFAIGIAGLFLLDRDRVARRAPALWLVLIWICIAGSRMVSEWLDPETGPKSPDRYLDGSPLDRVLLTVLLCAAVAILVTRARRVEAFVRANALIFVYFAYCGISVLWSDFPDVAFKRWTKALGDVAMVMIILTSVDPTAAMKRVLSRAAFLLIPLSVLLIKYYPDMGRGYNPWNWGSFFVGVSTEKNGLGYVCLICGLTALWRFMSAFQDRGSDRRRSWLIAHGTILAMTVWLYWKADSATALVCFLLGGTLLLLTNVSGTLRSTARVHTIVATVGLLVVAFVLLDSGAAIAAALGRDTTLTGRTQLWSQVLRMIVDPLFGTGFESFWLGDRVEQIWRVYWWHPNQAHNGYLEIFLNLGIVGIALLGSLILWGYKNIVESFRWNAEAAKVKLAFFAAAVVYNLTEAAFKGFHIVWFAFLLAIAVVPAERR
jgi:exopolysaccharide production protein ExoQ